METVVPPGVPTGTPQNPPVPPIAGAAPINPANPTYVTVEQFNDVLRRLDGMSGSLRKLEPLAVAVTPPPPPKEPDTLKSLKEQIDARDARITARERNAALNEALESAGVPADRRGKAAKYILAEHAERMQQGDDGSFQYKENDQTHTLHDWVSLYMKTDDGKFINPEPAPTVPGVKGVAGAARTNTVANVAATAAKLTYQDLMKPMNAALAAQIRTEQPDLWEAKREEFFATGRK